ncbi:hypothetical protein PVAP13_5NG152681 [Panicum virgatum]|uniref:Uncharacterized protein n=1 Tax=Panicum virgatum TaxID=38727 RepID=A0A8T0RSJ5_PANVG|nr:hypothetical protein PVAP13_5NG152681 [Panicum virgatum]
MDDIVASVLRLPCRQRIRRLRHLLRRQLRAAVRHHRGREACRALTGGRGYLAMSVGGPLGGRIDHHGGRRGGGGGHPITFCADTLEEIHRPPSPPDSCMAPGRILIHSPCLCSTHGWTALVRLGESSRAPSEVTSHCPRHGWTCFAVADEDGPSSAALLTPPAPPRASSPRLPSPTPAGPERRGTMAARTGWPAFYNHNRVTGITTISDPALAAPPLPPAPVTACRNATATARSSVNVDANGLPNRHLGGGRTGTSPPLRRILDQRWAPE